MEGIGRLRELHLLISEHGRSQSEDSKWETLGHRWYSLLGWIGWVEMNDQIVIAANLLVEAEFTNSLR